MVIVIDFSPSTAPFVQQQPTMKICAACSQELPKDKFSKKQWQLKQCRRCKECIAVNREAKLDGEGELEALPNDAPQLPFADGEEAPRHTDEDLFKQPPPRDECPICFHPLPLDEQEQIYQACCGKIICLGCIYAVKVGDEDIPCPFCRTPARTSDGEWVERLKERTEGDDAMAMYNLGCDYYNGRKGLRQNLRKAMKLFLQAGELGYAAAYHNIGYAYYHGEGVEKDENKAKYYYELAAMGGDAYARYNLGLFEQREGNMSRSVKHWMISAGAGDDDSLKSIQKCFVNGDATKDDFEKALRAHKDAKDEMSSDQRDKAAAARG